MITLRTNLMATLFAAILISSGCASTGGYSPSDHVAYKKAIVMPELKEGMTKAEILKRFGQPDVVLAYVNTYCYKSYFYNEQVPTRSHGLELRFSKDKLVGWDSRC